MLSSWGDNNLESHMFLFQVSSGCRAISPGIPGSRRDHQFWLYRVCAPPPPPLSPCRRRWASSCVFRSTVIWTRVLFFNFIFQSSPSVVRHPAPRIGQWRKKKHIYCARSFSSNNFRLVFLFHWGPCFSFVFPFSAIAFWTNFCFVLFFLCWTQNEICCKLFFSCKKETFVFPMMIVLR